MMKKNVDFKYTIAFTPKINSVIKNVLFDQYLRVISMLFGVLWQ